MSVEDYGYTFREAYALLHGGRPDEPPDSDERRPGEPLEDYLARSRAEALGRAQRQLDAVDPPEALRDAHGLLLRLLTSAVEADEALGQQVRSYQCGQFQESVAHSERLQALVAESARLDRELIAALRQAEESRPGTLDEMGIETAARPDESGNAVE